MSEKNCKDCKYWSRSDISDSLLPEDEQGFCSGLLGGVYYVQLDSSLIDELDDEEEFNEFYDELKIKTEHDFYCRNFKPKEEEKMQEHEKRMIEEYDGVQDRFLKLTGFLYTEKFNKLEGLDQSLLLIQHHHMEHYRDALHDRMVRAGIDKEVL